MRLGNLNNTSALVAVSSVLSCVAGALVSHILTKQRVSAMYEALIEEEVVKAKEFYSQRNEQDDIPKPVALVENDQYEENVEVADDDEELKALSALERAEELEHREKFHIQYHSIRERYGLSENADDDMAVVEQRLIDQANVRVAKIMEESGDDFEGDIPMHRDDYEDQTHDIDRENRSPERPYIIDAEEFNANDLDYGQNSLVYYAGDNVLVDERDQPIRDINSIIGGTNLKFGYGSDDENVVYIRNDFLEVDFEIVREPGLYAVEVLGAPGPGNPRGRAG